LISQISVPENYCFSLISSNDSFNWWNFTQFTFRNNYDGDLFTLLTARPDRWSMSNFVWQLMVLHIDMSRQTNSTKTLNVSMQNCWGERPLDLPLYVVLEINLHTVTAHIISSINFQPRLHRFLYDRKPQKIYLV
jgi:hypothetical protein